MQQQIETKRKSDNWLANQEPVTYGKILEFMRAVRGRADGLMEQHNKLRPKHGEVGGAAHMDPFVTAEGLYTFLRQLGRGETPEQSLVDAKAECVLCWKNWNAKCQKDIHMQRWEEKEDHNLDAIYRSLKSVILSVSRCESCG